MHISLTSITTEDISCRIDNIMRLLHQELEKKFSGIGDECKIKNFLYAPIIMSPDFTIIPGHSKISRDGSGLSISRPLDYDKIIKSTDDECVTLMLEFLIGELAKMHKKRPGLNILCMANKITI